MIVSLAFLLCHFFSCACVILTKLFEIKQVNSKVYFQGGTWGERRRKEEEVSAELGPSALCPCPWSQVPFPRKGSL